MAEETKPYRLKAGVGKHFQDGQLVDAGATVQLTRGQAESFRNKFEAADGVGFNIGGDVAGTNNTPNATGRQGVGEPGQNPELGQQESGAAMQAVGNVDKPTSVKDEQGKAAEKAADKK